MHQQQPQPYDQSSPPSYGQPAPPTPYPHSGPPAAPADAVPAYLATPPEAHEALARRGRRDITFGAVWLAVGLSITGFTFARYGGYMVVAWGPALYGTYKIIKGWLAVRRHS